MKESMLPIFSPATIQQELETTDRIVLAWLSIEHVSVFPSNHRTDTGVLVRVHAVRPGERGAAEVAAGDVWARPLKLDLSWNLCDGCKARESECCCEDLAADREAEHGPWCETCGSDGESGYGGCVYARTYGPGECPELTGVY